MIMVVSRNIAAGWAARAAVLLLAFVNIRLFIDCVGVEGLAAYSIIISLAPWLALMNLGLPITVQNAISRLRGSNTDYRFMRDQAYGTMLVVMLAFAPVSILVGFLVHRYLLINYPLVDVEAVIGVHLLIFIMGISQLMTQVMYAEHEAFWPNIYPVFAPLWTAMILFFAQYYSFDNLNILFLLLGISNLIMPLHAAIRLGIFYRAKFNLQVAIQQIAASRDQMLFAMMAAMTLSIDYLVMSRTLAALDIVNYNLTSRLFMTLLIIHGVLLATNWTPISDLFYASKKTLARQRVERVLKQGMVMGVLAGFAILAGIDPLVKILTDGKVDSIPLGLSLAFLAYVLLRIWTDTYAMAIQGSGLINFINRFIPIQAAISVVGQYFFALHFGATGIVFGLLLSYVLTASWIIPKKFYSITRE